MKKTTLRTICSIVLLLFVQNILSAQSKAIIRGSVLEAATGDPLPGANVYFEGTSIGASSDFDGNYTISPIPAGDYILTVSFIGFEDYTEAVTIKDGDKLTKDIKLQFSGGVNLDDIVITAQVKGQMKAINQQLSSNSMKNVVSAERIQELPDANAAEAIGRLPGVALERSGGEGSKVIIRGLSPKYTKVMINGIEMPSTGSGDRSTDLSMISPFSLGGIEVIKSPTAEQDADFIGGIVNFKLRTAPKGFKADALAEMSYNNLKNTYNDYNFNASVSKRFFDNKFGVFLQGNAEQRNRSSNNLSWGYRDEFSNENVYDETKIPNNPSYLYNQRLSDVLRTKKRYGVTAVLDYAIPNGKIVFSNIMNSSPGTTTSHSETYDVPNFLDNEQWKMVLSDAVSSGATTILSNKFAYEQKISIFELDANVAHSYSGGHGVSNSMGARNNLEPEIDESGIPKYTDYPLNSTMVGGIDSDESKNDQRQWEAAANVAMNFSFGSTVSGKIKIGGKLRNRDKEYDLERMTIGLGNQGAEDLRGMAIDMYPGIKTDDQTKLWVYDDIVDENYTAHEFLKGDYQLGPRAMLDFIRDFPDYLRDNNIKHQYYNNYVPVSEMNDYFGTEKLQAAYLLAEINITKRFTMIPGVRYEKNTTTYTSYSGLDKYILGMKTTVIDTNTVTRSNNFFLPNIQLKYEPVDWVQLRFGYSNTLARPSYYRLIPRTLYSPTNYSVNHRNKDLKPEQARNLDFMVSFKQSHLGLFTIGAFFKQIEGKIYSIPETYMSNPAEYGVDTVVTDFYKINKIVTDLNNDNTTYVKGLEFDWQTSFWYLPGALKGLILNTNYTYTHSEAIYKTNKIDNRIDPITWMPIITNIDSFFVDRLVNQATHTINVALGYDYKGFSGRVSMNHQSDMFRGVSRYPEDRRYSLPLTRWDISLKQALPWDGFQVYANFNNITAAIEKNIQNQAVQLPSSSLYYGTTITMGVRWRLK